jgi:maltooligosyltrehalose trehalohydrolase
VINDPETPDVGVIPIDESTALWRVWASKAEAVELLLDPSRRPARLAMRPEGRSYFSVEAPFPPPGLRYAYSLGGGPPLPDPCSRWQPDGINAPSAVYFPERYRWDEGGWSGVDRRDLVFYELHVGTFTPEGTFDAVIPRLGGLKQLGITAIELMPVGQFPGVRSWGYDGVHPFAPQHSYGGPEALQRLIEACHRQGMAVVLDVIFNHFGPEGNVFPAFGDYLTERYKTDWGPALNYDGRNCDPVRSMAQQAARMWVRDYRFDGLRFDAADQIYDRSPRHILAELAEVAHAEGERLGRRVHVFAETDLNDAPRFLHPAERGGYGFDGHWNDDFHHAVHNVLTGESNGYYADFAAGPKALAKAFEEVFVNNGNYSPFRGRRHGAPAREFPGDRFVAFTQNHDQVGNRLKSDRYAASLPPSAARLAAGLLLLAPRLPLLFMGEEYRETRAFPFFCDFQDPGLIKAVRQGRKAEFAYFGWQAEVPDPFSPATRDAAVLSWDWNDSTRAGLRRLYKDLLQRRSRTPALRDFRHPRTHPHGPGEPADVLEVVRGDGETGGGPAPTVVFNLSREPRPFPAGLAGRAPAFRSEVPEYGAEAGVSGQDAASLRPHEFVIFAR